MSPRLDWTALEVMPTPPYSDSPAQPSHWTRGGARGFGCPQLHMHTLSGLQSIPRDGGRPDHLFWAPTWAAQAAEEGVSLIRLLGPVALPYCCLFFFPETVCGQLYKPTQIPWTDEPGGLHFMGHKESDMTEWLTLSLSRVEIFKTTILNVLPKINNWEGGLAIVAELYSLAGLQASIQVVRDHGDWWWPKAILLVYLFLKSWVPMGCSLWALDSLCCAVLGHSVVSDSFWPHGLKPSRFLCPGDSPSKNTGVGCHAFLQVIFPTQGLNPGLLYCR